MVSSKIVYKNVPSFLLYIHHINAQGKFSLSSFFFSLPATSISNNTSHGSTSDYKTVFCSRPRLLRSPPPPAHHTGHVGHEGHLGHVGHVATVAR